MNKKMIYDGDNGPLKYWKVLGLLSSVSCENPGMSLREVVLSFEKCPFVLENEMILFFRNNNSVETFHNHFGCFVSLPSIAYKQSLINKNLGMVSYWGKQYYFIVKSLFSKWGPFYVFRVIKFSSFSGPSSHSEDLLVCENTGWWIHFCRKPLVCISTFYFLWNCYFHFYKHALLSTNAWKLTDFSG